MLEENETDLPKFFAWARPRVYREFEARLKADPQLDPNWTFSDIMQELLAEYRQTHQPQTSPARMADQD